MSNNNSLLAVLFDHRLQFSNIIDNAAATPCSKTATQLKAQVLIISQWLWLLSDENASIVTSQCLFQPAQYSSLANKAFCAGVLTANLSRRLNWHSHCAQGLISAALVMDIGLSITSPELASGWFSLSKLTPKQRQNYLNHPMASASYLHQYHVINKHLLKSIIEHQELLGASGFPNQLGYNDLSSASKILALTAKFSELVSPHPQRSCYSVKQALRYLAQQSQQYCPLLTRHLALAVNRYNPTITVELSVKKFAIIHSVNHETRIATVIEIEPDQHNKLVIGKTITELAFAKINQIIAVNSIYNEVKFKVLWRKLASESIVDLANSAQRLRPCETLSCLLKELDCYNPDPQLICDLIGQQPDLGNNLVTQLIKDFPSRCFNDSFHAIKMAGFDQSKALLAILGLKQQLNSFDFPARHVLNQKTDLMLSLSQHISQYTSCVLPNQAAIFSLLNIAPLYFERAALELPSRITINFKQINPNEISSLIGLKNSAKQAQISHSLAKQWDNRKSTLAALKLLNDQHNEPNLYQQEITQIFKLALLLSHLVYHALAHDDPIISLPLKSLTRAMKLTPKNIEQLINHALAQAPLCELSQDL